MGFAIRFWYMAHKSSTQILIESFKMGNTCSYLVLKKKQKNSGISISFSKNSLKILYFSRNIRLNLYGYYCFQIINFLWSLHHFPTQIFWGQSTFPLHVDQGWPNSSVGGKLLFSKLSLIMFQIAKETQNLKTRIFQMESYCWVMNFATLNGGFEDLGISSPLHVDFHYSWIS